ncbi:lysosomal amino acid transporter 1 homolog isoform 1-T2 [Rhinophrynus dorsalis]
MDGNIDHFPPLVDNSSDCPNGTKWILDVLGECSEDSLDEASVYLGLFSVVCFMFSALPQYYKACKTGIMDEAMSIWFLMGWLGGDTCNLVGTFLANQLPLQKYTAIYYVMADLLMISIYFYYKYRNKGRSLSTQINLVCGLSLFASMAGLSLIPQPGPSLMDSGAVINSRHLLTIEQSGNVAFTAQESVGFAIGMISSMFYLACRLPQIATNFKRKSTEGLALTLFFLVVVGNVAYGGSILIKHPEHGQSEGNYIIHHLPWLIGSFGSTFLDFIIFAQMFAFRKKRTDVGEREPLLQSKGATYA